MIEHQHDRTVEMASLIIARWTARRARLPMEVRGRIVAERTQNSAGAGQHTRIEIALAELRRDVVLDDDAAGRIGKLPLQPVADLDATLCSFGATIRIAPVFLPFCPMPQ